MHPVSWKDKISVILGLKALVMADSVYEQLPCGVTQKQRSTTKRLALLFKKSINLNLSLGPNFSDSFCIVFLTPPRTNAE
jgi:hypothetical protein